MSPISNAPFYLRIFFNNLKLSVYDCFMSGYDYFNYNCTRETSDFNKEILDGDKVLLIY